MASGGSLVPIRNVETRSGGARPAGAPLSPAGSRRAAFTPWFRASRSDGKSLYRGRAAVEREFGRLKNEWALLPLRVRGIERVRLHADLTILAKLTCTLARARA